MRIMAIDPGVTSGVCIFNPMTDTFLLASLQDLDLLVKLNEMEEEFGAIIIETYPKGSNNRRQVGLVEAVIMIASDYTKRVIRMSPGEWKPIAKAQKWKCDGAINQHEKDAFCIMKFHLLKERQK